MGTTKRPCKRAMKEGKGHYAYETIGRDERAVLRGVLEARRKAGWRLVTSVYWRSLTGPEFDKTELVFERAVPKARKGV